MISRNVIAGAAVADRVARWPLAIGDFRPDRAIRVATGVVAHDVCSKTFVSGLDPQTVFAETTDRAGIRGCLRWVLNIDSIAPHKTVDASVAGTARQPRRIP